ncbi:hypothetical protein C1H57_12425 [Clostridium sp. 2-1]|uniref:YecA family protein n=1 Tax=Clostridium TaxID=1485 RepID=UPI000CDB6410|nr:MULTISPECIES: SEC-C metal-binding domain-containing protein [Clostridium]POO90989.1 hypothetical protein C1H57_12425 [Clostridium sp. 2-1]
MKIPAICDNCKSIFPSMVEINNSLNITLGSGIVNCPFCGKIAHMMNGTFNIVGDTISVLKAGNVTRDNMTLLLSILENNKNANSPDKIKEEINKNIPELNILGDLIPKTRTELYAFIQLLIMIIQTFIMLNSQNNNINIEEAFYQTNYNINQNEHINSETDKIIKTKIGRNESCPCGSGKKYKNCCLRKKEISITNSLN